MTIQEAKHSVCGLSSGTLAHIMNLHTYREIDAALFKWLEKADSLKEDAFKACENWIDVVNTLPLV